MNRSTISFSNLEEVLNYFSSEDICREYLANLRWEDAISCPHCGSTDKIYKMKSGFKCAKCRKPFSVTKGTIFENSSIPLKKWLAAIWLITTKKDGVNSLQLHRDLDVTQKSTWHMLQKIRYALKTNSFQSFNASVEKESTSNLRAKTIREKEYDSIDKSNTDLDNGNKMKQFSDWLKTLKSLEG